jgi:hypothetical protein
LPSDVSEQEGTIDSVAIESRFSTQPEQFKANAMLESGFRIDSSKTLSAKICYDVLDERTRVGLTSPDLLFSTPFARLGQDRNVREANFWAEAQYKMPVLAQKTTLSIGHSSIQYQAEMATTPDSLGELWYSNARLRDDFLWAGYCLNNKFSKSRYKLEGIVKRLHRHYQIPQSTATYTLADLSGGIFFDFSKSDHLYITAGYKTRPATFSQLLRNVQIMDQFSIKIEQVDSSYVAQNMFVSVTGSYTSPNTKHRFNGAISYSRKQNEIINDVLIMDDHLRYTSLLSPFLNQIKGYTFYMYHIKKIKSSIQLTLHSDWSEGFVKREEKILPLQRSAADISLYLGQTVFRHLGINFKHSMRFNQQKIRGEDGFYYHDQNSQFGIVYNQRKWSAKSFLSYQKQQGAFDNAFWPLSFYADYRLRKPALRFSLTGRNVLNLKGNTMITPDFGPNYSGFDIFQTIRGQILGGVSWLF